MDVFIWRGCDASSARQTIINDNALVARAIALLTEPGGVPPDATDGPTICREMESSSVALFR